MPAESFKVLYIAGFSRCGSTLLGSMLGQIEQFINVGEIRMIWDRGFGDDRACGCGAPFSECEVWRQIVSLTPDKPSRLRPEDLAAISRRLYRTRRLPFMGIPMVRRRALAPLTDYLKDLGWLYRTVAEMTGSRVVVDSSKIPMHAYALRAAGLDVTVVHLIRDPRAVALSRLMPKRHADIDAEMGGFSVLNSSLMWNLVNRAIELTLGEEQYIRIGYKSLIENPRQTINTLASFVGEPRATGITIEHDTIRLVPTHTVFGNPGRFNTGQVRLRLDDRWQTALNERQRQLVENLSRRGMRRYAGLI